MARTVNLSKRIEKIKGALDDLASEIKNAPKKEADSEASAKIKISDIDFENEELTTLVKIQARLSKVIQSKI